MSRSNSSTAANDDSFHASSSTTDESIVASSTINADNSESTDFQSVTFEVSDDLKDRVDKLSSAYNSTLPLISQSLTGMAKLGKNTAITQLVTLAPTIEFVKPNVAQFARFYLYWKTELSTLDTHGEALKSCFEIFEKHDVDQMKEVDADTLAILAKAIHLSTKDSPGKGKLFYELGYVNTPPIFGLLEEIHSFHCGARSYPVSVERVINVIKYGSTYDNIGAVRIHLSFLECVKLFHPVKDDIPESKKASNFLENMSEKYKAGFLDFLIKTQVIKTVNSDYASKFDNIEQVLSSINDYEVEEEFTDRINFLSTFAIDKALRISRESTSLSRRITSTTSTMASTSSPPPPPGNGKPAGRAKGGRPFSKSSKPNTVSLSHLTVDSTMIASNSIDDLDARHRSSN